MSGFAAIGLANPKNAVNVGATLRAASAFGAAFVAYTGSRYKRSPTDVTNAYSSIPLIHAGADQSALHDLIPFDCVPVAVELVAGAVALPLYVHPARAFYVFGAEDATLGAAVLSWCRDAVQIPSAICLNLAAAVNVVLYDRAAKRWGK